MKCVNGFTLLLAVLFLNGCASYIAHKIVSPNNQNLESDLLELHIVNTLCDDDGRCIKALSVAIPPNTGSIQITLDITVGDDHLVWLYQQKSDDTQSLKSSKPLDNQLIVIFAGYNFPIKEYFTHQLWLQHMTGAEVLVIPSADKAENFTFGLDYVSSVVAEIKRRQADQVHLVGFSMGAIAAQSVAAETENAKLHLIAPMTNFKYSTKAIWDGFFSQSYYSKFISIANVEDAVEIVFDKSNVSPADINIIKKMQGSTTPTYIYTSNQDRIASASDWNKAKFGNITLKNYQQLSHVDMVTMLDQDLIVDFVSHLLARKVSKDETKTIGIFCQGEDEACLSQIEEQ
jgi:pimeloyl-ACP methyl ester carboxylesterase